MDVQFGTGFAVIRETVENSGVFSFCRNVDKEERTYKALCPRNCVFGSATSVIVLATLPVALLAVCVLGIVHSQCALSFC